MALTFGVTVLPDPPYQRLIDLLVLGERHGFEYGWTYDSHVLWQESTPTLALAAAATETIKLGHMVTNPGTREPTVVASIYGRRFGLTRKGSIAPGFDADIVVFDPATPFEFSTRTSQMNVDYDLFEGQSSTGSVRHTLCRGTMVYDRGEIVTQPGHGRFVPRSLGARAAVAS